MSVGKVRTVVVFMPHWPRHPPIGSICFGFQGRLAMTPLLLLVTLALASECLDCEVTGLVQWGRNRREERRESRRHRREYRVEPVQKPNVLVILIDDLGFNQVGYRAQAAGNEEVKTPRIDELAGNGIKLDRDSTKADRSTMM